jgi:hypothetical protein
MKGVLSLVVEDIFRGLSDPASLKLPVADVVDGDVRVGVVADASHARLFFCGGAESFASATRWFTLDITDGAVSFSDESWRVSAQIDAAHVTVTSSSAARRTRFSQRPLRAIRWRDCTKARQIAAA